MINMVAGKFLRDERGQLVGTPLKLVIAVVIGVAVLGILLQMMNLVSVMNPHSFSVEVEGLAQDGGIWEEPKKNLVFTVRDKNDGRLVQGAIVEIKGAGANAAQITKADGTVTFKKYDKDKDSGLLFKLAGAPYAKTTVSVTQEGYSRWTNTYLVKQMTS